MRVAFKALAEWLQDDLDDLDDLDGTRITVHRDYAYKVAAPYVILSAGSHPTMDRTLSGPAVGGYSGTIMAICVGVFADQARWVADAVRDVLSPGLRPLRLEAGGRLIETSWQPSGAVVEVDRDVTLPNTSTHPSLVHEEYLFSAHAIELDES